MCRIINDKCIFLGVDAQCILEPDFLPVPQMSSSFAYIGGANDIDAKNTQKYNEILYIKLRSFRSRRLHRHLNFSSNRLLEGKNTNKKKRVRRNEGKKFYRQ